MKRSSQQPVRLLGPPRVYFRHRSPPPTRKRAALPAGGRAPGLHRRGPPSDTWSIFIAVGQLWQLGFFLFGSVSKLCAFYPALRTQR